MSKLEYILGRIRSGARVRIVQDTWGQKRLEIERRWLPGRRLINLERSELAVVEEELRRMSAARAPSAVKIDLL